MHIYICIYVNIYIYSDTGIYIYIYISYQPTQPTKCVCVCVCVCVYSDTGIYIYSDRARKDCASWLWRSLLSGLCQRLLRWPRVCSKWRGPSMGNYVYLINMIYIRTRSHARARTHTHTHTHTQTHTHTHTHTGTAQCRMCTVLRLERRRCEMRGRTQRQMGWTGGRPSTRGIWRAFSRTTPIFRTFSKSFSFFFNFSTFLKLRFRTFSKSIYIVSLYQ